MNIVKRKLKQGLLRYIMAALIVMMSVYIMSPFLPPILMGALLALALHAAKKKLQKRGFSSIKSILVLFFSILILVIGPTILFFIRGSKLILQYVQDQQFLERVKNMQYQLLNYFSDFAPILGLTTDELNAYAHRFLDTAVSFLVNQLGGIFSQLPSLFVFIVLMMASLYVFLKTESSIRGWFEEHAGMDVGASTKLIQVLQVGSQAVFFSNIVTGLIQALFVCLCTALCGVGDWFLVLFLTFIASFIPILGAWSVALVLALYMFVSGSMTLGIVLLVVAVVSGTIDNIVRPFLAGHGDVRVPALVNIFSVLGGVGMMGLKGLFWGPFVALMAYAALPILLLDREEPESSSLPDSKTTSAD